MQNTSATPSSSFTHGLQQLLHRHLSSLQVQTSNPHYRSTYKDHLTRGLTSDIAALEDATRALIVERNKLLCPLNAFPPEILSHIFSLFAESERPIPPFDIRARESFEARVNENGIANATGAEDPFTDVEEPLWLKGRGGSMGWIALTHVCILWREMILARSALWAADIGALPGALSTMLTRAGDTRPLSLRLYGATFRRHDPEAALWEAIAIDDGAIARRVRELHMAESRVGYLEHTSLPRFALCPWTSLDTLIISAHELTDPHLEVIHAPRLRVVDFTNVACLFTSTMLTDLSIRGTAPPNSDAWTRRWMIYQKDLFTILEAHKNTLLRLRLDVLDIPRQSPLDDARIDFPVLGSMEYHTHSIDEHSLINHISCPSSTTTHIHINPFSRYYLFSDNLNFLFSTLQQRGNLTPFGLAIDEHKLSNMEDGAVDMSLRFHLAPNVQITSSTRELENYLFGQDTLQLSVKIERVHLHMRLDEFLDALAKCIPMASIEALSFASSCAPCLQQAAIILDRFPALRTLHLVDPCHCGIIMQSFYQPGIAGPRVPMLERLSLAQRSDSHVLSSNLLAQQLRARYGHATARTRPRLKSLRIDSSVVVAEEEGSMDAIARIGNLVDSMDWQGHRTGM